MTKIPTRDEFAELVDNHDKASRWVQVTVRKWDAVLLHKANGGRERTRADILDAYDEMSARIAELEAVCYDEAYDAQAARIKELETALRLQNTQGGDEEVLSSELQAEKAHGSGWRQLGLWKRT